MLNISITYQHGNQYTKTWIGHAKVETQPASLGGFSLSSLYNGGRFTSEKSIFECVNGLKEKYNVVSITKIV